MKQNTRIAAAAGHMHLLGKSISIDDVNPGTARGTNRVEHRPVGLDNQGARRLRRLSILKAGDTVRVRCTPTTLGCVRSFLP